MCYMSERGQGHVGVRELRQNLSVYLARVKAGVVDRDRAWREVARLVPLNSGASTIERLIAEGRARPSNGSLADLALPPAVPGKPLSEILQELRDEEDR